MNDGTKIKRSIMRQLVKAERAHQKSRYVLAEKACHKALAGLVNSEHAEKRVYLEARAVTMDKVGDISV